MATFCMQHLNEMQPVKPDFIKNSQRQSVAEVDAVVISIEMENLENRNLDQTAVKRIISNLRQSESLLFLHCFSTTNSKNKTSAVKFAMCLLKWKYFTYNNIFPCQNLTSKAACPTTTNESLAFRTSAQDEVMQYWPKILKRLKV